MAFGSNERLFQGFGSPQNIMQPQSGNSPALTELLLKRVRPQQPAQQVQVQSPLDVSPVELPATQNTGYNAGMPASGLPGMTPVQPPQPQQLAQNTGYNAGIPANVQTAMPDATREMPIVPQPDHAEAVQGMPIVPQSDQQMQAQASMDANSAVPGEFPETEEQKDFNIIRSYTNMENMLTTGAAKFENLFRNPDNLQYLTDEQIATGKSIIAQKGIFDRLSAMSEKKWIKKEAIIAKDIAELNSFTDIYDKAIQLHRTGKAVSKEMMAVVLNKIFDPGSVVSTKESEKIEQAGNKVKALWEKAKAVFNDEGSMPQETVTQIMELIEVIRNAQINRTVDNTNTIKRNFASSYNGLGAFYIAASGSSNNVPSKPTAYYRQAMEDQEGKSDRKEEAEGTAYRNYDPGMLDTTGDLFEIATDALTFGTWGNVKAALESLYPDQSYEDALAIHKAQLEKTTKDHPALATIASLLGYTAGAIPLVRAGAAIAPPLGRGIGMAFGPNVRRLAKGAVDKSGSIANKILEGEANKYLAGAAVPVGFDWLFN